MWGLHIRRAGGPSAAPFARRAGAFAAGVAAPWLVCLAFCAWQGVTGEFLHAVLVYAPALTAAGGGHGWEHLERLFTGNPDLAWWGRGTWPLIVLAALSSIWWAVRESRWLGLMTAWIFVSYIEVAMPGMFWQHYYLLATPGLVLLSAGGLGRWFDHLRSSRRGRPLWAALCAAAGMVPTTALLAALCVLQYREYVALSPEEIAARTKGGAQWSVLRELGRKLGRVLGPSERMLVWGSQSPLHFYSGADSVTPYFFTDPLLRASIMRPHRLAEPRKQRVAADVRQYKPSVLFVLDPPFPELRRVLTEHYRELGPFLFVRPDRAEEVRAAVYDVR
jgi:hypothetical protein